LLSCGILASLLYVSTDILAALLYQDYSYADQTVSELFAIDAPTRPFIVLRGLAYSILLIAFGLGDAFVLSWIDGPLVFWETRARWNPENASASVRALE
jgi:hypothetical protein